MADPIQVQRLTSSTGEPVTAEAAAEIRAAEATPAELEHVDSAPEAEEIPEVELTRMLIAAASRQPYHGRTPKQRKLFEQIKADTEALPPGTLVEVPAELP